MNKIGPIEKAVNFTGKDKKISIDTALALLDEWTEAAETKIQELEKIMKYQKNKPANKTAH